MMELSDLKLTSEQCEELLKLSHWSIAEAACYFHGLRAINLRNKLSEEFKYLTETEKILDINEVIAAAIEFFQEVPEMKSRYNSNYLNREARIAVDDLMLWANKMWRYVQGSYLPEIVQLYNIRTVGVAIPADRVIDQYTENRLLASEKEASSRLVRELQEQSLEEQISEKLKLANTGVGTVVTDSGGASKKFLSDQSGIMASEQSAVPREKLRNPLKLSKTTLSDAKFLIDKGVALGCWIDLCHSAYMIFKDCDSNSSGSKQELRKNFYTEAREAITESAIANGHTATYWPIVLFNFFEACRDGEFVKFANENSRDDDVFLEISIDSLFNPRTVPHVYELLKRGVRLDVWIALCCDAYRKFWPASESDKSTDKPVPIPEDEREEKYKEIRAWFPKKQGGTKGKFGSMNKSRLPEVLYHFLCPESLVGRPCNAKKIETTAVKDGER